MSGRAEAVVSSERSSLDRFLRPDAPAERLAALRILVGTFAFVYLAARAGESFHLGTLGFRPVGVVSLLLSKPLPTPVVAGLWLVATALAVPFTLGFRHRWTAPAFAAVFLWVTSYRNSFGFIFHTENLAVAHTLVLSIASASDAWSLDARRGSTEHASRECPRYGWPIKLLSIVTTLSYSIAGITKLRVSGIAWVTSDVLLNQVAYDNLRKAILGDTYSPIGAWAVSHPSLFKPLAALSLVIEVGAPLALFSKRLGRMWAFAMWSFHIGVLALMAIFFPYPLFGIGFASFAEPERLIGRLGRLRRSKPTAPTSNPPIEPRQAGARMREPEASA